MRKQETAGTQSIGRAAALLRAVASTGSEGCALGDVAAMVQLEKPTAHRILRRLVDEQFLVQDPADRHYHLGPLLYELGLAAKPSVPAHQWCSEALAELARISGDCAFLMGLSGYDSVCLDRREGHFPIKVLVLAVGQRRPAGSGAGSIALMSLLADDEIRDILEHNASRLQARGEPSTSEFLRIIERARREGYATKDAPDMPVRTLSMVVPDAYGRGMCALSVTSLTSRIEQRQGVLVDTLRVLTTDLTRRVRSLAPQDTLVGRYAR